MYGLLSDKLSAVFLLGNNWFDYLINIYFLIILLLLAIAVVVNFWSRADWTKQKKDYFELIPPVKLDGDLESTILFYKALHGLNHKVNWWQRLILNNPEISLEIVSTESDGIRFIVGASKVFSRILVKSIRGFDRNIEVKKVEDYLPVASPLEFSVFNFKLSPRAVGSDPKNFIKTESEVTGYLLENMDNLKPGELIVVQIVASPVSSSYVSRYLSMSKDQHADSYDQPGVIIWLIQTIRSVIGRTVKASANLFNNVIAGQYHYRTHRSALAAHEHLGTISSNNELEPAYSSSLRLLVIAQTDRLSELAEPVLSSLQLLSGQLGREIEGDQKTGLKLLKAYRYVLFKRRLRPWLSSSAQILTYSELAEFYHLPYSGFRHADKLTQKHGRLLPLPLSLRKDHPADVVLGENSYGNKNLPIGLTSEERQRHMYIVGGTGNGKTTMLEYLIDQDIRNGQGLAYIDPHGDSALKLLGRIPSNRLKDVIYLNPLDVDYPVSINLLEIDRSLKGSQLAQEKDRICEAVISVLRKTFDNGSDSNAFRIERILRNCVQTALNIEGATIFTALRLLNDAKFRAEIVKRLNDDQLKRFWQEEFGKAGDYQRVKLSSGPITRLERFEKSLSAQRFLGQSKSTIKFDEIIASKQIIICNFSKGQLGEDTSNLFGAVVLALIQLSIWRRKQTEKFSRTPFYLYVDEFQNFASKGFMALFSEARKFGLYLTIAQQSVFQLDDQKMISTILDNVGTVVCFRSKSVLSEQLLLPVFSPQVERGDIANLPAYSFYIKIAAIDSHVSTSGQTILLPGRSLKTEQSRVISSSRKLYAKNMSAK